MAASGKTPVTGKPHTPISWTDALILAGALFGLLIGVSLVSFEVAAAVGLVFLGYVILKLFTTKPK